MRNTASLSLQCECNRKILNWPNFIPGL